MIEEGNGCTAWGGLHICVYYKKHNIVCVCVCVFVLTLLHRNMVYLVPVRRVVCCVCMM